MATRKRKPAQGALELTSGSVVDVSIDDRMEQAFLDYSMSVIVSRALPDVRDGLKPVQRRILYSMWESGLRPDRPYRKCASAVGEVMKTYHPHGDSSIYDALVRLAQDFTTREPLVDGHGNFGSIDGDPPAAMRYTEARLSLLAMELLEGIDEDTVDEVENYDGYDTEPVVLPARFPNLLVNGASGIAVGMATTIPPHNLGEVIDACLHLVRRPDASVDDLMRHVPAPDLPGGARIVDGPGIRDAYVSGRGAITVEAIATTETRSGNLPRIIVTEIPYQVNKASLLERIAALVGDRKLEDIRDLRDESSRDGMRIVIECKRGADPAAVLTKLYRLTDLRTTINVNMVALVDGSPRTLGLREALVAYVAHQREVLTRRTAHRLERARARAHVVEGLLTAIDQLDAVIATIRAADSAADAKQALIEGFDLSEIQAQAVLDMQLRRLAALERAQLEDEYQELMARIAELEGILGDTAVLDGVLTDELRALRARFANERRTRIDIARDEDDSVEAAPTFEAQEVTVAVTRGGVVKSVARRRSTPTLGSTTDPVVAVLPATTEDVLVLVDAGGTAHRIAVADVPVVRPSARGTHVGGLLGGGPDAPVIGAVLVPEDADDVTLVTVSAQGLIKRTLLSEVSGSRQRSIVAAGLKDADELVAVALCYEDDELLLAHDGGLAIRFSAETVRPMGRSAAGVAGMRTDGARVVALGVVAAGAGGTVLSVTSSGTVRRFALDELSVTGRGGKGVKVGDEPLAWFGPRADLHLTLGGEPTVVRTEDLPTGRRTGRGSALGGTVIGAVTAEVAADEATGDA
ncbi:MAG: DNA topoisomerase 4 subunit A [Actinomycetota bacterium]|nr:DNA topoisomerase 4 subunit A [Actinomycetota bacterium]